MASNSEIARKLREERNASQTTKSMSNSEIARERRAYNKVGFDTFESDLKSTSNLINDSYNKWQTSDSLANNLNTIKGMQSRIDAYQTYNQQYGNNTGTDLSDILNGYNDVIGGWNDLTKLHSSFKTEDAFNQSRKNAKLSNQFSGLDYASVQNELKKYNVGSDEYNYLSNYSDYSDLKEFDKALENMSDGQQKKDLQEKRNQYALDNKFDYYKGIMSNSDFDGSYNSDVKDNFYQLVNNGGDTVQKANFDLLTLNFGNLQDYDVLKAQDYSVDQLRDDEKAVYNYLYAQDPKKAMKYLDDMKVTLNKRQSDTQSNQVSAIANQLPILSSSVSIPMNVLGGAMDAVDIAKNAITGQESNPYGAFRSYTNNASTIRDSVSQKIEENTNASVFGQNPYSFLYQTLMSVGDSMLGASTLGVTYTPLMGTSAYQQKLKDMKEAGASDDEAIGASLVSGVAEALFEYVSLDKLVKIKDVDGFIPLIKSSLKQMGIEASEEMATEYANILSDSFIRGNSSDLAKTLKDLESRGYTREEAEKEIKKQIISQIGLAGAGGALSGGLSGMLYGGANLLNTANTGKQIREAGNVENLYNLSKEDQALKDVIEKYGSIGLDNLTDAQIGNLRNRAIESNVENYNDNKRSLKEIANGTASVSKIANQYQAVDNIQKLENMTRTESQVKAEEQAKTLPKADENTIEEISPKTDGMSEMEKTAYALAYSYGKSGKGFDNASIRVSEILGSAKTMEAYESGLKSRRDTITAQQQVATDTQAKNVTVQGKFDDSIISRTREEGKVYWNDLSESQKSAVNLTNMMSQALGVNISYFASEVGEDGKRKGANGRYDSSNNTIYLDVYAGMKGMTDTQNEIIIPVASHEITHWMEKKSPLIYDKLRETVLNSLAKDSTMTIDDRIGREIERLDKAHGGHHTEEDAVHEIVARACEDMLKNSNTARKMLLNLSDEERQTFADRVKSTINNLIQWINDVLKSYSSRSEEAKILSKYKEDLKQASKLWDQALKESIKMNQAIEEANVVADIETESAYSLRTWESSEYVTNLEESAEALAYAVGVSKDEAKRYIESINSVAKVIYDSKEALDYIASNNSSFVSNAEYGGSIDFSTLCKKRRLFTGTLQEIQRQMRNTALTTDDYLKIRQMMLEDHLEATCGCCYVEGSRAGMGVIMKKFIEKITKTNPSYVPDMYDVNTPDGLADLQKNHPDIYEQYDYFMNNMGRLNPDDKETVFSAQRKPKQYTTRTEYKGEIKEKFKKIDKVEAKNLFGGIRFQSFSDFEIVNLIDCMQVIMDMSMVGLAGQAYTKVYDFADALGQTGLKINLSLIAKGVDENGDIILDDVEGMDHKKAYELRKKYSDNVGTICVIFTDEQLASALKNPQIDYIIPFHRSQWGKKQYDRLGLPKGTKDYTRFQNERMKGANGKLKAVHNKEFKQSNYMPNEYWDFSKSGRENAQKYIDMCNKNGRDPKFSFLLDGQFGNYTLPSNEIGDNYFKLLIDFKMYNNDGIGVEQKPVRPIFDNGICENMLKRYALSGESASKFPIANDIVDRFVSDYKATHKQSEYADRDSDGNKLSSEQIEFFKNSKARDKKGNLIQFYHGTDAVDFNEFNTNIRGAYFSDKKEIANGYMNRFFRNKQGGKDRVYTVYLDLRNPLVIDARGSNWNEIVPKGAKIYKYLSIERNYETRKPYHVEYETAKGAEYSKWFTDEELVSEFGRSFDEELNKNNGKLYYEDYVIDKEKNPLPVTTEDYAYYARQNGYDGLIVENVLDAGNHKYKELARTAVAFNSNQIKNTDNKNPTSSNDIRYADRDTQDIYDRLGETEKLQEINKALSEEIINLKERLALEKQITNGKNLNNNQLLNVARHIKSYANSNIDTAILGQLIRDAYNYLLTEKEIDGEAFFGKVNDIAKKVVEAQKSQYTEDPYMVELKKEIIRRKIKLNSEQLQEIKSMYGDNYKSALRGLMYFSEDGVALDQRWQELANMYPDQFDSEVTGGDQIRQLIDIAESARDGSKLLVEYDKAEAVMDIAQEIYNGYWDVNPIKTTADKYQKQIDTLNKKHQKQISDMKDKVRNQKLADDIHYGKVINKIRNEKGEVINRLRQQRDNARKDAKAKYDKYKDNADKNKLIKDIVDISMELNKKLTQNSVKNHVPEVLKEATTALLNTIDFSSRQMLGMSGGDKAGLPTSKDLKLAEALRIVHSKVSQIENEELKGNIIIGIPDGYSGDIEQLINYVDSFNDEKFILYQMDKEHLTELKNMVKFFKATINGLNKWNSTARAREMSDDCMECINYLDSIPQYNERNDAVEKLKATARWKNTTPVYAFDKFGDVGKMVFGLLQDGWGKFAYNIQTIDDYKNSIMPEKEWSDSANKWDSEIHTFDILQTGGETKTIKLTTSQIMSLYCLEKREQALGHIYGGGIKAGRITDEKGKVINQNYTVNLTQTDLANIIDTLTEQQKMVADKMQKFMNSTCSDWGNEVTMKRFGFNAYEEDNYFPIASVSNNLKVEDAPKDKEKSLFRLLNMSFTKSLTKNANNAIEISSIYDVFSSHSSDMAKYNALALPILDAYRWLNYKHEEKLPNGQKNVDSMRTSMDNAFGDYAQRYLTTFLQDMNGMQNSSRDLLGNGFFRNSKIASTGFNIRVAMLQFTSYPRAYALLDSDSMGYGLSHKGDYERACKLSGIVEWKSLGYYSTNVQKGVTDLIKGKKTAMDKLTDASMAMASNADEITIGHLLRACEYQVKKSGKYQVGTKEFDDAVGKLLTDVIYRTQVVDSTMTRSEMMRSSDGKDKILTAFMSEPTLSYNLVVGTMDEYNIEKSRNGKESANKKFGRKLSKAISAYVITNIVAGSLEGLFDALRDKDEEVTAEELMKMIMDNIVQDMSLLAKVPYIKDIISIAQGYSNSYSDTQWATYFVNSAKQFAKVWNGEGSPYNATSNLLKGLSYVTGIPLSNATRDIKAILNRSGLLTYDEIKEMFDSTIGEMYPSLK